MEQYLPEGFGTPCPMGQTDLIGAMHAGDILEATALCCDEQHNLLVRLGAIHGIIPRAETAWNVDAIREIGILSRVGLPVCFVVTDLCAKNGRTTALLSRRAAQERALAAFFQTRSPGDVLHVVVTSLAPFGAFCDIGCGVTALLHLSRISVSRLRHSHDRFHPGQELRAVVLAMEPETRRVYLTTRELYGTWQENAARFAAGQTVTGVVRTVMPYGCFIELTPNLSGLSEPDPALRPGDAVSVYIRSIQPERQKIKLSVIQRLPALPPQPLRYFNHSSHISCWEYGAHGILTVF